jgi:hypothetical protein
MKAVRIAVPSGVGDTYWALAKIKDFKLRNQIEHLTLLVQRSALTRALEWADMVDFVDEARELRFRPDHEALTTGYSFGRIPGADYCFWPNAVVDRGQPLREWLPNYELDLDFPVHYVEPPDNVVNRTVVYASSDGIHSAWFPMLTPAFWSELLQLLGNDAALIGARWDDSFRQKIAVHGALDLVGQTSLMQVTGVLKRASAVVGVISGMTILANHWMTPCVAFCPSQFPPKFPHSWVRPGAPYVVLRPNEIHSAAQVAEVVRAIARKAA